MATTIKQAVKEAVFHVHALEDALAKKGFTFEDWCEHQEVRFGIWKNKQEMEEALKGRT
jgi:hypothetical protein